MKFKKIVGVALGAVMLLSAVPSLAAETSVTIEGEKVEFENAPFIESGTTWVAMEEYLNVLGAKLTASADEDSDSVTIALNGATVDVTTREKDGVTYIPLRSASEGIGETVYWNAVTGEISVTSAMTDEGILNKHYYTITNAGQAVDIVDGGLTLSEQSGEDSQIWQMTKKSDGYYSVINKSNGHSPDVPNGSTDAGVTLIQYSSNNNDNQRFGLEMNEDGTWCIQVKHSKLYLTVNDGAISQEEYTGEDNQKFEFSYAGMVEKTVRGVELSEQIEDREEIDTQYYYELEEYGGEKLAGEWTFVKRQGGYYDIVSTEGEEINDVLLSWTGEYYTLIDQESGDALGDYVITKTDGKKNAVTYEKAPLNKTYVTIETGGEYLAVTDDGPAFTNDAYEWQLLAKGNDFYSITSKESAKSLDVPNVSEDAGVALIMYSAGTGDNQRFKLIENEDGSYKIQVKHSELYFKNSDGKLTQEEEGDDFVLTYVGDSDAMTMGAVATPFMIDGEDYVRNMKVQWNEVYGAERYDVYRSEEGGAYELIASCDGLTVDDYNLTIGKSYTYKIEAISGLYLIDSAETEAAQTYQAPDIEYNEFSNLSISGLNRPNSLNDGETYYSFSQKGREDGGSGFGSLVLSTSTDDVTYGNATVVLTIDDILASPSAEGLEACNFESINYIYNKETGMLYMWAHMEDTGGYSLARVAVAYGKPGEKFTFNCFRPDGDDSRDMNIYVDDDNSAYLIAAVHNNADLALYKLTEDWTDVERKICIVNSSSWRELPSILKYEGVYYLFSSGTAGWYPTQGMYNTATSMEGPWSELKSIGNLNTFSSQSGTVSRLKSGGNNPLMLTYRWMWWWQDATTRSTQNRLMPIKVSNGYAFFDYYDNFYYNVDEDILIPIQKGMVLSQGKPTTATLNNSEGWQATDGSYFTEWVADGEFPESITINLEQVYELSEMQISWRSWNGSETYYNYTVEASLDGENYEMILDNSEGYTDYAFTVDELSGKAQYVRINILGTNSRSGHDEYYTPNAYEIKILGYGAILYK